ncbi:formate/nitrite transporter family protein [Desulfoscipio sp. XC116]|uniref:formate/nitrite transporter family protein n=1 Tax=Desulfoscipio sp. XC116 TaxID=3144975 RepID=UPI00325AA550
MSVAKPAQILEEAGNIGILRAQTPIAQTLSLSFLAGAYIAFGAMLMITVVAGLPPDIFGTLAKFIGGALFPIGLIMVIIGGADLFTGDILYGTVGAVQRKISVPSVAKNWLYSYVGNLFGALFIAYFMSVATGLFTVDPWLNWIQKTALAKTNLSFYEAFWRGVGCNWLVCLACWLAIASDNVIGKIAGIWFLIMAFVTMGFEHSIANMFFIPLGIFTGAPVSWTQFWLNNELPVTLGNIVGGSLFCGVAYLISYGKNTASRIKVNNLSKDYVLEKHVKSPQRSTAANEFIG